VAIPRSKPPPGAREEPTASDLAAVLHETTNALTVLLGWLERARQPGAQRDAVAQALERASTTALATRNALRRAIGASVDDDSPEAAFELAQRVTDDLAVQARQRDVTLQVQQRDDGRAWHVDHAHAVWQILTNLLLNAIAVTPRHGRVELAVGTDPAEPESVRFTVTDEGPGI
jgi:signal transduction histidine kinase